MNKDKSIKDLKERNDKLANQYRLRDIRCVHLEIENERLQQENKQLKGRVEVLENTLREILHFCNHLHNDCKYNLNDGHIRKIRNICKRELKILGDKEND